MSAAADHASMRRASADEVRAAIRAGRWTRHTAGLADGKLQANLVVLPETLAADFLAYCRANPKPCPLAAVSRPGDPRLPGLGDVDVRTDAAGYRIWRDGEPVEERTDLMDVWRGDHVAFALGCSFTFERALAAEGLRLAHVERDLTVPMYDTVLETTPAGPFGGGMVVSMRPIAEAQVDRAAAISARYPLAHGGPVHVGDPAAIGIGDLSRPDYGDPVPVGPGEVPMFWACGVTPQAAIRRARPPLCATHAPGRMLITDLEEDAAARSVPDRVAPQQGDET
jgi:uncharacterized protein YcsI (UPF0317 family)